MELYDITSIESKLNAKFNLVFKGYIILSIIEVFLFPEWKNLYAVCISLLGIFMTQKFLLHNNRLVYYPVSTLSLIVYTITFEIMPLPATLIELKPITFNMHSAWDTFWQLILLQMVLLFTQQIYIKVTERRNILRTMLTNLNFFTRLSNQELWALILLSAGWYIYKMIFIGLYTEEGLNVNSNFTIAEWAADVIFSTFYQILFLFYFREFNVIKDKYKIHTWTILFLAVILFIVGIGTNMRTAAVVVFANAAFSYIVYRIYYPDELKIQFKIKYLIPLVFLIWFFSGPFQNISQSMIAIRGQRYGMSTSEIISMTLSENNNNNSIKDNSLRNPGLSWDEYYYDNDIMARFCSLKILDETIFHAQRLNDYGQNEMREELYAKVISALPKFIQEKFLLQGSRIRGSLTDKLYSLSVGGSYSASVRIGTLQGLGIAMFGQWYFFLLIPLYFIIFYLEDSMITYKKGRMVFSILFFVSILMFANYFADKHYYQYELRFIVRGYWEMVLFFLLGIKFVRMLPFIKH